MNNTKVASFKHPCLCCGRPTHLGIPFSICNSCIKKVDRYVQAKERQSKTFRQMRERLVKKYGRLPICENCGHYFEGKTCLHLW